MTIHKDLKRLVRARMNKTGESYTSARTQVTRKHPASTAAASQKEYAALAGLSDAVIKEKTGRTWAGWVKALDEHNAHQLSHTDIARLVKTEWNVASWWTQSVTVGYERIKGLRVRGQQRNGTYQTTKSRTFNVPVAELFNAWLDAGLRKQWLEEKSVTVRTSIKNKSIRLGFPDGSIVAAGFLAKGKDKSSVTIEQTKLPDRESVDRVKEIWATRFSALAEVFKSRSR